MAQDAVNTSEKPVNPEAEIKKLLQAHLTVLKDKLGRAPTSEEIAEALKGAEGQSGEPITQATEETPDNSAEPKILKLKVYYGQGIKKTDKGDVKTPDPNKILFYENHEGKAYDCGTHSWLPDRPPVLDHLPSRPLLFDQKNADIIQAILHGVIDGEDFGELEKSGAIAEHTRKIYHLQKRATDIQQQLEKSEEIEVDADAPEEESEDLPTEVSIMGEGHQEKVTNGTDVVRNFMDTAGVQYGLNVAREEFGEQGADLFAQILQAALSDVDEKTRMLVREEMDSCLGPVLDVVQELAAHIGVNIDLDEEEHEVSPVEGLTNEEPAVSIESEIKDTP